MGARVRAVVVVGVVLTVGAFIGSAVSQWWSAVPAAEGGGEEGEASPEAALVEGERVRVEVLNGGGRTGMARAATERLRDRGFDVVYYGNAESFDHDRSVVLDRVERPEFARAVAAALDIGEVRVEPDSNLYLDVSVVLGAAWDPPRERPPDGGTAKPAWWDLRRFFPKEPGRPGDSLAVPPGRAADPGQEGEGN